MNVPAREKTIIPTALTTGPSMMIIFYLMQPFMTRAGLLLYNTKR
jgi:hypothetical protein